MSVTLTGQQIKEAAEFLGMTVDHHDEQDILETQITIAECPKDGIGYDEGVCRFYSHISYLTEYPEEGVYPLGEEKREPIITERSENKT